MDHSDKVEDKCGNTPRPKLSPRKALAKSWAGTPLNKMLVDDGQDNHNKVSYLSDTNGRKRLSIMERLQMTSKISVEESIHNVNQLRLSKSKSSKSNLKSFKLSNSPEHSNPQRSMSHSHSSPITKKRAASVSASVNA